MNLTWKQFKEEVDKQLLEKGIDENEDLWYIDTCFPREVEVSLDTPDMGKYSCGIYIGD